MSYKICRLIQDVRRSSCKHCMNIYTKKNFKLLMKQCFSRTYTSNISTNQYKNNSWYTFVKRRKWFISFGIGVSLLTAIQWRHLEKYQYTTEDSSVYNSLNVFVVKCYYFLPFRIISKIWGWLASLELPVSLRPTLYGFYARAFNVNLDEIDMELSDFPSLADFFVRPLKYGARPIDKTTNIVSPADGKVLYFGPVTSCCVQQVKGVTYNLRHFLGDINASSSNHPKFSKEDDDIYIKSLLKDPMNQLCQLTVYLAPGNYHRFHSPSDWEIELRRHFQGKLLSVNPKIAQYLPDLFSLNERVIYIGKWASGFMAYSAVGATNVGSIKVYCDKDLHTNAIKWPDAKRWKDANLGCTHLNKGELFGEFRMGSTIVLLFEAPKDFKFRVKVGQTIKMGQALNERVSEIEEKRNEHSL
ncbi:phosphatidylserine decarboxylase proenzyme, mitochondrial isoform X1 [Frieseomelitta varia]|uniref:phosphatidylserine decarboxylase proenzyme, mitochondrial isoform X1 n=1 Tax=Frieseomelitta varia TaxID=561572 RepID=UPI001CB68887|nr:phosphatidylserine decarboxylase proenzyme, mitochondrial isoform X1 [Frieseomelitta varia]